MAATYYTGNTLDTTSKEVFSSDIINKIVAQEIDSKIFTDIFGIFTSKLLDTGYQVEEIEVGNLTSTDFDPTGAGALTKANMDFKTLYHKKNRDKTFKATISMKQLKTAMLSKENLAAAASAITSELWNSTSIEDFEAMKALLVDICSEQKAMVICDLNGNGGDMDALTKAIQTLASRMNFPSTQFNFSGYKKEFNTNEDLVLIIDSATRARLNVDSLANAFNMDMKKLVQNIIVIDEMPTITYTALTTTQGLSIAIGETNPIITHKYNAEGEDTVSGSAVAILLNVKAIKRDKISRELDDQKNAAGSFINYFLHAEDVLSFSTLKNAIVLVD